MADPKYAGLPGIALDQPDMFETSGMGEVEEEEEEETSLGEPAPVLHSRPGANTAAPAWAPVLVLQPRRRRRHCTPTHI